MFKNLLHLVVACATIAAPTVALSETPEQSTVSCYFYENGEQRSLAGAFDYSNGYTRNATLSYTEFESELVTLTPNTLICLNCWIMGLRIFARPQPDLHVSIDVPGDIQSGVEITNVGKAYVSRKNTNFDTAAVCTYKLNTGSETLPE